MKEIAMDIQKSSVVNMNIVNTSGHTGFDVQAYRGTKDHSMLKNLDFEHSGHTGFQREGDYPDEALTNSDIERLLNNFS